MSDRHAGMTLGKIAAKSGECELTKYACRLPTFCGAAKRPAAVRRTFNLQPKLVLIYRLQKDEILSQPK